MVSCCKLLAIWLITSALRHFFSAKAVLNFSASLRQDQNLNCSQKPNSIKERAKKFSGSWNDKCVCFLQTMFRLSWLILGIRKKGKNSISFFERKSTKEKSRHKNALSPHNKIKHVSILKTFLPDLLLAARVKTNKRTDFILKLAWKKEQIFLLLNFFPIMERQTRHIWLILTCTYIHINLAHWIMHVLAGNRPRYYIRANLFYFLYCSES